MNTTNRLNLLLSDILQNESLSNNEFYQGSSMQTLPPLAFAEHDYHHSPKLPSVTATFPSSSKAPVPPHRSLSSLKHQRQHHLIYQFNVEKQQQPQQQQSQPLLNSSTLDDMFSALTLECEQYLAALSAPSYQNKNYDQLIVHPSTKIQTNVDSNEDDYENLHSSKLLISNDVPSLKTDVEATSPKQRQVISISVSSKVPSFPMVTSSQTCPLLSTSSTTRSLIPPVICHSSEEDSIEVSSSSINRRRRRRMRKHQIPSSTARSNSSSEEHMDTINGSINVKKSTISKRSCSTDHRQQRIKSIYDNYPVPLSSHKLPTRRIRRRDISWQKHLPISAKYQDVSPRFPENRCPSLSVSLTTTRPTTDFIAPSQQQQRWPRLELVKHQPITLLDRMHHKFYGPSPTPYSNNNNIPTHRIPSYPVY